MRLRFHLEKTDIPCKEAKRPRMEGDAAETDTPQSREWSSQSPAASLVLRTGYKEAGGL